MTRNYRKDRVKFLPVFIRLPDCRARLPARQVSARARDSSAEGRIRPLADNDGNCRIAASSCGTPRNDQKLFVVIAVLFHSSLRAPQGAAISLKSFVIARSTFCDDAISLVIASKEKSARGRIRPTNCGGQSRVVPRDCRARLPARQVSARARDSQ